MQKLILAIATILSLAAPGAAPAESKIATKTPQTEAERAYLEILNHALVQGAPEYVKLSEQDKLSYGHYTCQALATKVSLDTILFDYLQAVAKDVSPNMQQQAGFFLGSSMYAGVHSFCPSYLPQLNDWGKKRFVAQ